MSGVVLKNTFRNFKKNDGVATGHLGRPDTKNNQRFKFLLGSGVGYVWGRISTPTTPFRYHFALLLLSIIFVKI